MRNEPEPERKAPPPKDGVYLNQKKKCVTLRNTSPTTRYDRPPEGLSFQGYYTKQAPQQRTQPRAPRPRPRPPRHAPPRPDRPPPRPRPRTPPPPARAPAPATAAQPPRTAAERRAGARPEAAHPNAAPTPNPPQHPPQQNPHLQKMRPQHPSVGMDDLALARRPRGAASRSPRRSCRRARSRCPGCRASTNREAVTLGERRVSAFETSPPRGKRR